MSSQDSPRWEVFVYLAYCYIDLQEYKLAVQACQASIEIYPHISAAWVCCDAYMELGRYEEALSTLDFYSDNRRASSANMQVTLLRRLKKWETLSKFLRELESDPWFFDWEARFDISLALSYCELGRFDEAEEVVLAGLIKSPQGEEAAHLHLLLAIAMAKQSRISSALTECQKAIQLGLEDDERIQWSWIGYLFLEYGEYELASICFDLGLKSRTMNAVKGEASIIVHYGVQCGVCNAEDFPWKRYIQKKPPDGPGGSFNLCESCFSQHVEQ